MASIPAPQKSPIATDVALTMLRIVVAIIMIMHGLQKWRGGGFDSTATMFEQAGVPLAGVAGPATMVIELFGGIALLIGVLTRVVAILFTAVMAGAIVLVHGANGFYATEGGYEFVLLLGVASLVIAITGGGSYGIDGLRRKSSTSSDSREG